MIADIGTIMWKEFKELFHQRGRFRGGSIGVLIFVFGFGILMPLQTGPGWVESPIGLVFWAWLPYLLVSSVTADTFAGERERHTLETMLASCISDRALLVAKIGSAVVYGWGLTIANILVGLVTVNVAFSEGNLLMFPPATMLGILGISLLVAVFGAGLGVTISLRAATVRQAQQTMGTIMFVMVIPLFALPMLPEEWKVKASRILANADLEGILAAAAAAFLVIDTALVLFAMSRFKRARLILD
jgi:ABC-2 type transport system permease protein